MDGRMSGNSKSEQPRASNELKPSQEVAEKMRPISRQAFNGILQRAANPKPLSRKPAAKKR